MIKAVLSILVLISLAGCASVKNVGKDIARDAEKQREKDQEQIAFEQGCTFYEKGHASWYGYELYGNKTANGEKFEPMGITAAHKKLPFGTIVKVVMDSGKGNTDGVFVRINDRGPFVKGRIIDLSKGAAEKLGMPDTQAVHIYRCS